MPGDSYPNYLLIYICNYSDNLLSGWFWDSTHPQGTSTKYTCHFLNHKDLKKENKIGFLWVLLLFVFYFGKWSVGDELRSLAACGMKLRSLVLWQRILLPQETIKTSSKHTVWNVPPSFVTLFYGHIYLPKTHLGFYPHPSIYTGLKHKLYVQKLYVESHV